MSDEQKLSWDPDELRKVMAAHHAEFDEKYKELMAKLERICKPPGDSPAQ